MGEAGHEHGRSRRLLVAEDHYLNRILIERVLDALGYRTVMVENGREAVEAVRATPFDAVLLDLEMPVMGGLEAASAIRALGGEAARLPLLALTAHDAGDFQDDALRCGFDGFVSKPVAPGELGATLQRLIPQD